MRRAGTVKLARKRGKTRWPRRVVLGMDARRHTTGDKFPNSRPIPWKLPSLYIAIVTLVAVTGAVLSDAPRWPFKPAPLSPQETDVLPFDLMPSPDATASPTA